MPQPLESISADNLNKLKGTIEQVPQIHTVNEKLIHLTEAALATPRVMDKVTDGKPNDTPSLETALRQAVGDPTAMG